MRVVPSRMVAELRSGSRPTTIVEETARAGELSASGGSHPSCGACRGCERQSRPGRHPEQVHGQSRDEELSSGDLHDGLLLRVIHGQRPGIRVPATPTRLVLRQGPASAAVPSRTRRRCRNRSGNHWESSPGHRSRSCYRRCPRCRTWTDAPVGQHCHGQEAIVSQGQLPDGFAQFAAGHVAGLGRAVGPGTAGAGPRGPGSWSPPCRDRDREPSICG